MEIGTVRQVDIDSEMQVTYLDYAMSVIVARAGDGVTAAWYPPSDVGASAMRVE